MPEYLDVKNWPRRDLFEFFREYSNPYFNVCTRIDVTALVALANESPDIGLSLAYHYLALRVANEIEPFRYRLRDHEVEIVDVINGGTTVLLPNESFAFAYFDYHENFREFAREAKQAIEELQAGGALKPTMRDNLIYFTTLPWISFTSFAHARNRGRGESVPRIAFGKFLKENGRVQLPISVEVHHALMDGLHVGRFLERLEEALLEPKSYVTMGNK